VTGSTMSAEMAQRMLTGIKLSVLSSTVDAEDAAIIPAYMTELFKAITVPRIRCSISVISAFSAACPKPKDVDRRK